MNGKHRTILILSAILILLCIGFGVLLALSRDERSADHEETTGSDEPVPVLYVHRESFSALTYTYDRDHDGEAERWSYALDSDGKTWQWADDPEVALSYAQFDRIAETLAAERIRLSTVIDHVTEADLAAYGLDTPSKTVTFTDKNGTQTLTFGTRNTYNNTYCALLNGNRTRVFQLSAALYDLFELPVEAFVNYDDLPDCKPIHLMSLRFTEGSRTVDCRRSAHGEGSEDAFWTRSVDGADPVRMHESFSEMLDLLLGDLDYLRCYSVSAADLPRYGLTENTIKMEIVYEKKIQSEWTEQAFILTLGDRGYHDYYYANPVNTTYTMLLGSSVWYQLLSFDDAQLAAGIPAVTDTTSP